MSLSMRTHKLQAGNQRLGSDSVHHISLSLYCAPKSSICSHVLLHTVPSDNDVNVLCSHNWQMLCWSINRPFRVDRVRANAYLEWILCRVAATKRCRFTAMLACRCRTDNSHLWVYVGYVNHAQNAQKTHTTGKKQVDDNTINAGDIESSTGRDMR